jgi:hypothetical protein
MTEEILPSSFRDPSGFVFRRDGALLRQINPPYKENYTALMSSGLYQSLVDEGLLVPHEDLGPGSAQSDDAVTVIRPEQIPFISYPYEWCFGQLKDAALATLRIQKIALEHGMSLRDSSAYNIQFRDGRPVLIDTLSFETRREGEPWVAYRQFCQHFLAPLALMSHVDVRLGSLSRQYIDGVPLDLASTMLPRRTKLRPALGLHIHAHARSQKKHQGEAIDASAPKRAFTARAMEGLIESLSGAVRRQTWEPKGSTWIGYYADAGSYSDASLKHKRELVERFLDQADPKVVWDLGANTGVFSRLAAARGALTVSFEFDPACVEASYQQTLAAGEKNILPLIMDLNSPSPAIGWENRERLAFAERGPADTAMALALIHHLAIGNNVPLSRIASFFRALCRSLIVEFVPKSDPKAQLLLASREDIFPSYTREAFEDSFSKVFRIERTEEIKDSDRVLYLMR